MDSLVPNGRKIVNNKQITKNKNFSSSFYLPHLIDDAFEREYENPMWPLLVSNE
jgi:hypothetical protein